MYIVHTVYAVQDIKAHRQTYRRTDRQIRRDRWAGSRQTGNQADRQADRKTDRQKDS